MLATSERVSPCRARSSPRSVGRATTSSPSRCSIAMRCGTCCESSPSGPFTMTRPGESETDTPAGISIGAFPIRLKFFLYLSGESPSDFSPDKTHDFAADAELLRRAARDQTVGGGHDRRAHPAEDAREAVLAGVDAAAGLGDAAQVSDDALAAPPVLELDHEGIEGLAALEAVVLDVALVLQDARDLDLRPGRRHRRRLVEGAVRVPDPREHVGDGVVQHAASLTSSTSSCRE